MDCEIQISENFYLTINDNYINCYYCKIVLENIEDVMSDNFYEICTKCFENSAKNQISNRLSILPNKKEFYKLNEKVNIIHEEIKNINEDYSKLKKEILNKNNKIIEEILLKIKEETMNKLGKDFNTIFAINPYINNENLNNILLGKDSKEKIEEYDNQIFFINKELENLEDKNLNHNNIKNEDIKYISLTLSEALLKLLFYNQTNNENNILKLEKSISEVFPYLDKEKEKIKDNFFTDVSMISNFEQMDLNSLNYLQNNVQIDKNNYSEFSESLNILKDNSLCTINNSYFTKDNKKIKSYSNSKTKNKISILNEILDENVEFLGNGNVIPIYNIPIFLGKEKELQLVLENIFPDANLINIFHEPQNNEFYFVKMFVDCDKILEFYNNIKKETEFIINNYSLIITKGLHKRNFPYLYALRYKIINQKKVLDKNVEVIDLTIE